MSERGFASVSANAHKLDQTLDEKAKKNVARTTAQIEDLERLAKKYRDIANSAEAGSAKQVAAAKRAADAERQLERIYRDVGTASETSANKQIAAHHRADRAASTHAAGLKRLAGSALALGGAYVGVTGVINLIESSVKGFQDEAVATARVTQVFGEHGKEIVAWAKTTGIAIGLVDEQSMRAAANMGVMLKAAGMGKEQLAPTVTILSQMAGELAALRGLDPESVMKKMIAATSGRALGLKQLGIIIDNNMIKEEAMRLGLIKSGEALTAQAKAQAAVSLITKQAGPVHEQFLAIQNTSAVKSRELTARIDELKDEIGSVLEPTVRHYLIAADLWLSKSENQRKVTGAVKTIVSDLGEVVRVVWPLIQKFASTADHAADLVGGWHTALKLLLALKVASVMSHWVAALVPLIGVSGGGGLAGATSAARGLRGSLLALTAAPWVIVLTIVGADILHQAVIDAGLSVSSSRRTSDPKLPTKPFAQTRLPDKAQYRGYGIKPGSKIDIWYDPVTDPKRPFRVETPDQNWAFTVTAAQAAELLHVTEDQLWKMVAGETKSQATSKAAGQRGGGGGFQGSAGAGETGRQPAVGETVAAYAKANKATSRGGGGVTVEEGFDCSGFVVAAYRAAGIQLPHNSAQQFRLKHGQAVRGGYTVWVSPSDVRAGDAVYFDNGSSRPQPDHVGIMVSATQVIAYSQGSGRPGASFALADAGMNVLGFRRWVRVKSEVGGAAGTDLPPSDAGAPPEPDKKRTSRGPSPTTTAGGAFLSGIISAVAKEGGTAIVEGAKMAGASGLAMVKAWEAAVKAERGRAKAATDYFLGVIQEVWDARTQEMIDHARAQVKDLAGVFTGFEIGVGEETPTEKLLREEQEAYDEAERHKRIAEARASGDRASILAAERDDWRAHLEQKAKAEREAADEALERQKKNITAQRAVDEIDFKNSLAKLEELRSQGKITRQEFTEELRKLMDKYGISASDAGRLLGEAFGPKVTSAVDKLTEAVEKLYRAIMKIPDKKTTTVDVRTTRNGKPYEWGSGSGEVPGGYTGPGGGGGRRPPGDEPDPMLDRPAPGMAGGGPLGSNTGRPVLITAHEGEYVVRATSAHSLGVNRLDYINRFGKLPRFQDGGPVIVRVPMAAGPTGDTSPGGSGDTPAFRASGMLNNDWGVDKWARDIAGPLSGGMGSAAQIRAAMRHTHVRTMLAGLVELSHGVFGRGGGPRAGGLTDAQLERLRAQYPELSLEDYSPGVQIGYAAALSRIRGGFNSLLGLLWNARTGSQAAKDDLAKLTSASWHFGPPPQPLPWDPNAIPPSGEDASALSGRSGGKYYPGTIIYGAPDPGWRPPSSEVPMAGGAYVRATPGGILARIGEGQHDEIVLPVVGGGRLGGSATARAGGGNTYYITVQVDGMVGQDKRRFADEMVEEFESAIHRRGARGGLSIVARR